MKSFILAMTLTVAAFASDIDKRPPPFPYRGAKAVFADFTQAVYHISYDVIKKEARVEAVIDLVTAEDGHVIFDLHTAPTKITIDEELTSAHIISTPNKESKVKVVDKAVLAGAHQLKITLPLTQLVEWSNTSVKSAFWMSDLTDRGYLERYLPTNFIFDRIPMTFYVKFIGVREEQKIYANAVVENLGPDEFKVTYRDDLNTTCQYFHTTPARAVAETRFIFKSVNGRDLPAVIYLPKSAGNQTHQLESLKQKTIQILDELEKDYGPFLHPSVTVYVNGSGGMEYSGATMTSESALGHELFHSYFARGVMPADGNAGWIDEALARWRDNGYQSITSLEETSRMANHGTYYRATDRLAYSFGERFMALLNGKVSAQGGLKLFLRNAVEDHSFDPLTVSDFISFMNIFYEKDFTKDFQQYVYGLNNAKVLAPAIDHDIHRQLTLAELQDLL